MTFGARNPEIKTPDSETALKMVVLITGASRGLGRELSLRFAIPGIAVAVNYLKNRDAAFRVVDDIAAKGGTAAPFCADAGSSRDVDGMVEAVYERWGTIDILINNAGISVDNILPKTGIDEWERTIATNLTGAFNAIRAVSRIMMKQRKGHIINISSWAGLKGREGQAAYSASKAALTGLSRSAALELGRFNIKVNTVLPGLMQTDMADSLSGPARDKVVSSNILNDWQDIDEVAEFIYNLSLMNHVSGQVFNLDSRVL